MDNLTLREKSRTVGDFAAGRIARLQKSLLGEGAGAPAARATLAKLRRLGTVAGGDWMLVGDQLFEDWPTDALGEPVQCDKPTRELLAVQATLRFYALHQQSQKTPMAMDGREAARGEYDGGFGWGCRCAEPKLESAGAIQRRLACIEAAVDFEGVLYQVQGLIPLLKGAGVPLDYYAFACDLYLLQFDVVRDGVIARWAKDYYLPHGVDKGAEEKQTAK